jgi:imidazolonepropionase-like amidohydrolase
MALGAGDRIGLLRKGFDASVLLLNGNPLKDIGATEQISLVMFRGERIDRPELFNQK